MPTYPFVGMRDNATGVWVPSGTTATNTPTNLFTENQQRVVVVVNVSAFTSGTLTVTINGITESGYTYPLLVSSALGAAAVTPLRIGPGLTPSSNAVANDLLPKELGLVATVSGGGVLTYGIDYVLGD